MVHSLEITSDRRLRMAAKILGAYSSAPEQIQLKLIHLFADIDSGRKKSADLVQEIMLGESRLQLVDDRLVRIVKVACVEIPCPLDDGRWLWEICQEYNYPAKIVERNICGVSEKIQGEEDPLDAAIRGLKEELGLSISEDQININGYELSDNSNSAYNGITSKTLLWKFTANISKSDFRDEYREIQKSKATVFRWK